MPSDLKRSLTEVRTSNNTEVGKVELQISLLRFTLTMRTWLSDISKGLHWQSDNKIEENYLIKLSK